MRQNNGVLHIQCMQGTRDISAKVAINGDNEAAAIRQSLSRGRETMRNASMATADHRSCSGAKWRRRSFAVSAFYQRE